MLFRQLFDRDSSTYTYLLADTDSREAVLIDPVRDNVPAYLQFLQELELKLIAAIDTHVHADHITALGSLREATGCLSWMGKEAASDCVSARFRDGSRIPFGRHVLQAIYTPGHTDDSYSFFLEEGGQRYLFSGDTLLIRGTGRTDFQNGSAAAQYHSLFSRLLTLPADTQVYPGHDYKGWTVSSIDEEKRFNPRLQVADEMAYVALMASLKLANPGLMDVAVPANRACGQPQG
jgi:glyoxylase-like metal-dependent hydrolase (beta-lactamase superfamily II)